MPGSGLVDGFDRAGAVAGSAAADVGGVDVPGPADARPGPLPTRADVQPAAVSMSARATAATVRLGGGIGRIVPDGS